MTVFDGLIDDFAIGDDLEIERTVEDIPTGVVLANAWFMVKKAFTDADADAIITKAVTTASTDNGQITDSGSDGVGIITFFLSKDETLLLSPLREYRYSIRIKLDNGKTHTPEVGILSAYPTVKRGSV